MPAFPISDGTRYGLIERSRLAAALSHQFGRALFDKRPIAALMDPDPLVVEATASIHSVGDALSDRGALTSSFIIVENGRLRGIGSGIDLVREIAEYAHWAMLQLQLAQDSLIRSEKLASLGSLVGGIAHEINTPIGITLTAATQFAETVDELEQRFAAGTLARTDFERFVRAANETSRLVVANVERAAELVASFKQVAIDQTSEERRTFALGPYLHDVLRSLRPQLKHVPHRIDVDCDDDLVIDSYPGAISQIVSNLLNNALAHAFDDQKGTIRLGARPMPDDLVELSFEDDGRGIPHEMHERVFEPFFTTARNTGGSGLGLSIVHNITVGTLHGSIDLSSSPGHGTRFRIVFPRITPLDRRDGAGVPIHAARFGGIIRD
jgi:signal transduction histidine kinase